MTDYDRYDAAYDAALEAYERELRSILAPMVRREVHRRLDILAETAPDDESISEDDIREQVEEELRPLAEEILSDRYPCGCNDYHCPCH